MVKDLSAKRSKDSSLTVSMNGKIVGRLTRSNLGVLSFEYHNSWLEIPDSRPVSLSLPLRRQTYQGDIVSNFFDNLLPDSDEIRARIQRRFQLATSQPFDLLKAIGSDCIGALQLTSHEVLHDPKKVEASPLTDTEIAAILSDYRTSPLGMNDDSDFRISLAGAQEKTALLFHQGRWWRPHRATPTSHIFKQPIGILKHHHDLDLSESCENEWLCLKIAYYFGFAVPKAEVKEFDAKKALIIERFDRRWSSDEKWLMRIPQEDMCQALGYSPNMKYQSDGGPGIKQIMNLLLGSTQSIDDRRTFLKAQILFWILAAPDGHAKNFSIQILPGSRFKLTPLYDILSMYPLFSPFHPKRKTKMAMALKGKKNHYNWDRILARHFESTAEDVDFPAPEAKLLVESMLEQIGSVVAKVQTELPSDFPAKVAEPIFEGMLERAKFHQ